jgi:lysozyme family protein
LSFDFALAVILKHEGGYVNHPSDPGGETNFGISKRAYPSLNIKTLTKEQAGEIYRRDYWDPIKGDSLPLMLSIFAFDTAVNMGVSRAAHMLQGAAGVTQDGVIGPKTLKACQKAPQAVLERMATLRIIRYTQLDKFDVFGRGWITRTVNVLLVAKGG